MRQLISYLTIIILCSACYEDYDNTVVVDQTEIPETTMDSGLTGRAYNNDGSLLNTYTLRINDQDYDYEEFHYEYIDKLRKFGQVIYLMSNNEVIGFSNKLLLENDINGLDIVAFPDHRQYTISSNNDNIAIDTDLSISINRQQLLNTQNTTPQSDILVNHFSTTDQQLLSQAGHFAYDESKNLLVLDPVKLFYINTSSEGNSLTIDTNSPLTIASANPSASIFYLSERGYWKEVSSGDAQQISEFGYYMIANASPGVYNEGVILKGDKPVSYIDIEYEHELDTKLYNTKSSSLGRWAMVTYPEESVELSYNTPCGDRVSESIYTSTGVSQLDIINRIESDINVLELTTQVIDCSGDIAQFPAINIVSNTASLIYPYTTNNVDTWIAVCQDDVDVTGYNVFDKQAGPLLDWNIDIEDAISYLSYCDNFEDGFSFIKIRDDAKIYASPTLEIEGNKTRLTEANNKYRMNFDGMNLGSYEVEDVRIFLEDIGFGNKGYRITCEDSPAGCGIEDFSVTHYDNVGDGWTRISFSGEVWMQTINPPLAGNFQVEGVILRR